MGSFTNKNVLEKKWLLKFVALLTSVTIVWRQQVHLRMHITILCLKVEQNQVCEQLRYVVKIWHCYVNTKNNSKVDYLNDN